VPYVCHDGCGFMQKGIDDFQAMQQKGFFVTHDGCILPHELYGTRQKGAVLKGHQRSIFFFTGVMPAKMAKPSKGKPDKSKIERDVDGWPMDSQISHRCHRSNCIRPDHLQLELRVQNQRRNWCGILNTGSCDCGMQPPCVRKYHPAEWLEPNIRYCSSRNEVAEALADMPDVYKYRVVPRQDIVSAARKAENAMKRKRAGEKVKKANKAARLV
jgi:hypothetical protein